MKNRRIILLMFLLNVTSALAHGAEGSMMHIEHISIRGISAICYGIF